MTEILDVSEYDRLLKSISWKIKRRAMAAGVDLSFDDLLQEARVTYYLAKDKFDPDFGVKFSTYLYKAASHNLRRISDRAVSEAIKTSSLDEQFGEDDGCLHDILPGDTESMSDRIDRLEAEQTNFSRLSAKAKMIVAVLDSPPPALRREVLRMQAFREHCKRNNMAAADRGLNVQTVAAALGFSASETRKVKREFKEIMEELYG